MAVVTVRGVFLSAGLHETNFNGNKKVSVQIDLYQPDSPDREKNVSVRTDELDYLKMFQDKYTMGEIVELKCRVGAYKDRPNYSLLDVVN